MTVVGSLMVRRVMRWTLSNGRTSPPSDTTEYIQSDRKREEHRGVFGYRFWSNGRTIYRPTPRTAHIKRCDLQTEFLINFEDREFTSWPIRPIPTREELRAHTESGPLPAQPTPTVLVETETVDTGERRELFGRPARRVITTQRAIPLTGSMRGNRQTVIDGWYIDLDTGVSCEAWWWSGSGSAFLTMHKQGDEPETPTFRNIGEPERGYAVIRKIVQGESVTELEVTELSTAALDTSLFDVPSDFSRVGQIRREPVPPLVIRVKDAYERLKRRARLVG